MSFWRQIYGKTTPEWRARPLTEDKVGRRQIQLGVAISKMATILLSMMNKMFSSVLTTVVGTGMISFAAAQDEKSKATDKKADVKAEKKAGKKSDKKSDRKPSRKTSDKATDKADDKPDQKATDQEKKVVTGHVFGWPFLESA